MLRLYIDSSTAYLFLSLWQYHDTSSQLIFEHWEKGINNHSENLLKTLDQLLTANQLKITDLNQIYVGKGPGSYTGVRVACTVAKIIGYATQIKIFSFSSLDRLVSNYLDQDGQYIVSIDARRGNAFAKVIEVKDQKLIILEPEQFIELETLVNKYPQAIKVADNIGKVNNLDRFNLATEITDIHNFVPTYLRSGI